MKIIVVLGPADTGKTTAIRQFLEGPGRRLRKIAAGEVKVILPVKRGGKTRWVGVASKGDSPRDVAIALTEFQQRNCDVAVCAARPGAVMNSVTQFAAQNGHQIHPPPIPTQHAAPQWFDHEARRVAREIDHAL